MRSVPPEPEEEISAVDFAVARLRIELYGGIQHPDLELRHAVIDLVNEVAQSAAVFDKREKTNGS